MDKRTDLDDRKALVLAVIETGVSLQQQLDGALGNIKGITYSEYRLLGSIGSSPGDGSSRVDLARAVGLTPSGVTRALRPLEKLGMVETVRHERDARRSVATLTAQGRELLEDADGVVADSIELNRAVQQLSPTEVESFAKLLSVVRG